MPLPWPVIRRSLADRWHVPPWVVDEAPMDEIVTELHIQAIEAREHNNKKKQQ